MADFSSSTKNRVKANLTGIDRLLKRITPLGDYEAHVGVLASQGGNDQHKGAAIKGQKITLLELAAIHEFGSPSAGVPERSFIRATFNSPEGKEELSKIYAKLAKLVMSGRMKAERAVEILGQTMQTMVKRRIMTDPGVPPPNKESTIAAKDSSRPLVDTGQLVGAINYEIRKKGK